MKHGKKIHEEVLIVRALRNDPDAFKEIFNVYVDRIYRFVFFKVSSREEAEDITSEVFLKVWQYIALEKREVRNLSALLYQSARNLVIDFYRKKSRTAISVDEEVLQLVQDTHQQNLLLQLEVKGEMERVEKVIKTLKDEYKDVILLRYIEELSVYEIAKVLNKSKGAVRVLIHRALKILREKLE